MSETAHRDAVTRRMEGRAVLLGQDFDPCPYPGEPRWRIDATWIEFECGCRAERKALGLRYSKWDPVVFTGLPEQAVYDHVCWRHEPRMNFRLRALGFRDFKQWHRHRRPILMEGVA